MAQANPPLAHPMPILQGQPVPLVVDNRRHLEIITSTDGIAQRFKDKVPSKIEAIGHWIKAIRASMKRTKAGVHWLDQVVIIQGQPAQVISHTVPMTVVFDFPSRADVRQNVKLLNGNHVQMIPPADVMDLISSQVYNFILPLIDREDRKLHEGVPEDDAWALIARIKSAEAELGTYLELLEARRDDLTCTSLRDYPTFRASVLQLKMDWQSAIDGSLVDADEDWPNSKVKQFISDELASLLGDSLGDWTADVNNRTKTIAQTFERADAIYKTKMRRLKGNKRKLTTAQLASITAMPPVYDPASEEVAGDLSAEEMQMYSAVKSSRSGTSTSASRSRYNRRDDQPPSWLAPMMATMATTIAQAIVSAQSSSSQSHNDMRRPSYSRGRGRGRGGRGRGRGRGRSHHTHHQYLAEDNYDQDSEQFLADFEYEPDQE